MTSQSPFIPAVVGIGAIFIDDIVLPDGVTHMGQLGGGVTHALMGAALWGERPGLVALAGQGLPEAVQHHLAALFDLQGLHLLDLPQIRAWQIFEHDGTRRELYRTEVSLPFIQGAQPQHLPECYRHSSGYYLLQDFEHIQPWAEQLEGIILWEPLQQIMQPGQREAMRQCLRSGRITVVSPNLIEAQTVYATQDPNTLVQLMLEDGAQIVALRMGKQGSIVASQQERYTIPPVTVPHIVDQTGAGNTYCGAFLAALVQGYSLRIAGQMAAVAASFCLEQIGTLNPLQVLQTDRDQRLAQLAQR